MNKKQKKVLIRVIVASVLLILCAVLPTTGYVRFATFMVPYLVIGYDILKKAWKGILNKQVFDENFLMAVATVGAILLGEYPEGVAVMLFLPDRRTVPELCCRKEPPEYQRTDGYPPGLCKYRGRRKTRAG